jgi:hypothetical protein
MQCLPLRVPFLTISIVTFDLKKLVGPKKKKGVEFPAPASSCCLNTAARV